jgi:hypothetical protein
MVYVDKSSTSVSGIKILFRMKITWIIIIRKQ